MLDIRFFRNPAFSTGTAGMMLVFLALYGVMFLVTQYFQLVLGYSPLSAAARLLPMALTLLVVSLTTPKITARFGAHRTVAAGMLSLATGLLLLSRRRHRHALLVHRRCASCRSRRAWRWRCRR